MSAPLARRLTASRWQVASAPASPPRLPVTLVALDTKKLNEGPEGDVGVSSSQLAPVRAPNEIRIGTITRLIGGTSAEFRAAPTRWEKPDSNPMSGSN